MQSELDAQKESLWMPGKENKGRLDVRKLTPTNLAATWVKDRFYKEFSLLRMWINASVTKQNQHLTQINFCVCFAVECSNILQDI